MINPTVFTHAKTTNCIQPTASYFHQFSVLFRLELFLLPYDNMQVHNRTTPSFEFAITHLDNQVERRTKIYYYSK